jgi:DNA-directed RNA polymerase specialized sigma24 family protein
MSRAENPENGTDETYKESQPRRDKIFPLTSSSLFVRLSDDAQAEPAMKEFVDVYYKAIQKFIAVVVRDPDAEEDLTQSFFTSKILEGNVLGGFNRERGRFHEYLKGVIRHFLSDNYWRARRRKTDLSSAVHPDGMEGGWESQALQAALSDKATIAAQDAAFMKGWAEGLVRKALELTEKTCKDKGQEAHFALLKGRYFTHPSPSWGVLGEPFHVDGKTAQGMAVTAAGHFKTNIRKLAAQRTRTVAEADEEILGLLWHLAQHEE